MDKQNQIQEQKPKYGISRKETDGIQNMLMAKVNDNKLTFPKGYQLGNALTSAYLMIQQDSKLSQCTSTSITQSLIDMATLGLDPSKTQCYFIPYNGTLKMTVSYFGKQLAVKRIKGVKNVISDVLYKDTEYKMDINDQGLETIKITKPCPLQTRNQGNIIGAWCKIVLDPDIWGVDESTCIMTIEDIKNSWSMSQTKGNSKAHQNFTTEMAKRTVINKCIKNWINTNEVEDEIFNSLSHEADEEQIQEVSEQTKRDSIDVDYEVKKESIKKVVIEESKPIQNKLQNQAVQSDFEEEGF